MLWLLLAALFLEAALRLARRRRKLQASGRWVGPDELPIIPLTPAAA